MNEIVLVGLAGFFGGVGVGVFLAMGLVVIDIKSAKE